MPIHDWSKMNDGAFHAFHLLWIGELQRALNGGLLPKGYFALAEQSAVCMNPDVLTLKRPKTPPLPSGGTATLAPPRVSYNFRLERAVYTSAQRRLVIRHSTGRRIVAVIELVSPGNKSGQQPFDKFVEKIGASLFQKINVLVVDLHLPTPRDPNGIHAAIWESLGGEEFIPPPGRPLTLASYEGEPIPEAHVEPVAVGSIMPDMPLYLEEGVFVPVPLERTYAHSFAAMPDPEDLTGE